jgi:hypothetical protein
MNLLPFCVSHFRREFRQLFFDNVRDDRKGLIEVEFFRLGHSSLPLHKQTISKG